MLDVRKLRLLRDLAHHGTIAAVADALSYTPSAVSQQLAALEREAGVPLLERSGRRVTLTAAGAVLVEHTEAVLAALEQADAALAATRTGLVGPLRIGAFPTAVRTLLPAALVALGRDHPGLELRVIELDPVAAPDVLRAGQLDVALVHDYDYVPIEPDPALATEPLIEETMYLASTEALTEASTEALTEASAEALTEASTEALTEASAEASTGAGNDPILSVRHAPWITGTPGTLCHTVALRACQAAGFTPRVRHYADDFITVLTLVAAGQGVALIPQLAATNPPPGVTLIPLATRRRTRLAYRRGRRQHPAVAACVAAIHASAASYLT